MAEKYLGERFDLHGGGIDLRFPHHENERAQAQGVHGAGSFAKYWLHNGFIGFRWVHQDQVLAEGSKIAKSDEKMRFMYHAFVARTCIERHGGEAVRLWLLTTQYRNPIAFDVDLPPDDTSSSAAVRLPGLEEAERRLEYAYLSLQRLDDALLAMKPEPAGPVCAEAEGWLERLYLALDDDFNTPVALAEWTAALGLCNRVLDNKLVPAPAKDVRRRTLWRLAADLKLAAAVLGLLEKPPAAWLAEHCSRRVKARGLDQTRLAELLAERAAARQNKDFARSDILRQQLFEFGVEVMDTPAGARWRVRD
jgi:cysteinyl-tRNA synthetase